MIGRAILRIAVTEAVAQAVLDAKRRRDPGGLHGVPVLFDGALAGHGHLCVLRSPRAISGTLEFLPSDAGAHAIQHLSITSAGARLHIDPIRLEITRERTPGAFVAVTGTTTQTEATP